MEYGFAHSLLVDQNSGLQIIKITGRLIVRNINELCHSCNNANTVYANISKDDWNGNIATSQVVMAPKDFYFHYFLTRREEINDSQCRHFEHVLYDGIVEWKKQVGDIECFGLLPNLRA